MKDIKLIRIKELYSFPENPFHVEDDIGMEMLLESIKEYGIMSPIIVRPDGNCYEIVSGHRRVYACEKAGIEEVPVGERKSKFLYSNPATPGFWDGNDSKIRIYSYNRRQ